MNDDNKVIAFRQPDARDDSLTAVLRAGARRLLEQAIEAETETFLAPMNDLKLPDGRDRMELRGVYSTSRPTGRTFMPGGSRWPKAFSS